MGGILGLDTVDVPYYKKPKHKPCKQFVLILSSGCLVIKKEKKQGVQAQAHLTSLSFIQQIPWN